MCSKVFTTTYVCIHAHPHPDTSEIKCPSSLKENKQKKPPQSLTSFIKGILSPARFHKHFHSILPSTHSFHSYKHRYLCKWDHHVCHSLCHRIRRNHPKCTIPGVNRCTFHSGRNPSRSTICHPLTRRDFCSPPPSCCTSLSAGTTFQTIHPGKYIGHMSRYRGPHRHCHLHFHTVDHHIHSLCHELCCLLEGNKCIGHIHISLFQSKVN